MRVPFCIRNPNSLGFFLELFFCEPEACGRPQRLAVIVQGQTGYVSRIHTARRFCIEHHEHRTARCAFTKR